MTVIDNRLIVIHDLQKKYAEICQTNPVLAQEMSRRVTTVQQELAQDMAPLYRLLEPWAKVS